MDIWMIISVILIPTCVMIILSVIQNWGSKTSEIKSDKHFVIMIPNIVWVIGMVCAIMALLVMLGFTLFSNELPHLIFYLVFGFFFGLGLYLILKTLYFKVIVADEKITVFATFRKPYTFTFSEIISAIRQVKKNQIKSERIVIKTVSGKRVVVESSEISYKRFMQRIKSEVKSEYLFGFE